MKKLLLPIFLFAQFIPLSTLPARGQSPSPTPAPATQATTTPAAGQAGVVKEADALSKEVVRLYQAGKFDEALPLAERVLKLREEEAGREHPSVAVALKNLGAVYSATGKAPKARQLYARALSIYEKNPAANDANISKLLDALGLIERFAFNNYAVAAKHYERSLALKQNSLGAEHDEVLRTLYELAELYELLNHNDKAVATHRRVIAVKEKHEATHPCDLVLALNRFSCLTERLGMKAETLEADRRAEQITITEDERLAREAGQLEAMTTGCGEVRPGLIDGKAISKPQPSYPAEAKRQRISGKVTIFVTVDVTGHVIEAHPCGPPLLSEAALRAAYAARFTPMLLNGKPVKVRGKITYKFVLM